MIRTIGLIELNSIARGIESTDTMLKAGQVDLVFAKPICPGKYISLISGDVGAVKAALAAGQETAGFHLVDSLLIPSVHPGLIPAINAAVAIDKVEALGVVEYFNISSAITGADTAAKAGIVQLMEVRLGLGIGGKSYFSVCGTVSDVKSAVAAASASTEGNGVIVNTCVIPSPSPELFYAML